MVSIAFDIEDEVVHRSVQPASPVASSCRVQSGSLGSSSSPWLSETANDIYASLGEKSHHTYASMKFIEKSSPPRFAGISSFGAPDDFSRDFITNKTAFGGVGIGDHDGVGEDADAVVAGSSRCIPRVHGWSEIRARLQHVQAEHVFCDYYEKATSFFSKAPLYLLFETLSQCLVKLGCEIRMNFDELCLEGQIIENMSLIPFRVNVFLSSEHEIDQTSRTFVAYAAADNNDSRAIHLVEFQRRSGDSFEFTHFFHSVLTAVKCIDDIADFLVGFPRGVAKPFVSDETSAATPIPNMAVPSVSALPLPPPGPYDNIIGAVASASVDSYSDFSYSCAGTAGLAPPSLTSASAHVTSFVSDIEKPVFRSIAHDYYEESENVSPVATAAPSMSPKQAQQHVRDPQAHDDDDDLENLVVPPPGTFDCQTIMLCASLLEMIFVGCASKYICQQLDSARLLARLSKVPENKSTLGDHQQSLPIIARLLDSKHKDVAHCGLVALREYLSLDSNRDALVGEQRASSTSSPPTNYEMNPKPSNSMGGMRTSASDPSFKRVSASSASQSSGKPSSRRSGRSGSGANAANANGNGNQQHRFLKALVAMVGAHLGGETSHSMQYVAGEVLNLMATSAPRAVCTPTHVRWLHANCSKQSPFFTIVRSSLRKLDRRMA